MKKLTFVLGLCLIAGVACKHNLHSGLKGSGNRVVQKREAGSFKSISSEGAFNVRVVCQKDLSLEVEGDDNVLALVDTEVSNDVLHLKNTRSYSVSEPIEIRISVPDLEGLSVSGAGKFDITGLKNEKFEIDSDGAPQISVSGSTNVVDIDSSGAAKIDTHNLRATKGVVDSKGVSSIEVDVRDQLDVTISGPSTVTYQGDPSINKTIHGPGKLERRASEGAWEFRTASYEFRIS